MELADSQLNIGDETRLTLQQKKPDKQKYPILGIRSFYSAAVSHMQTRLHNTLLRDLYCLSPLEKKKKQQLQSVQNLSCQLQPQLDVFSVQDEWKLYQSDMGET